MGEFQRNPKVYFKENIKLEFLSMLAGLMIQNIKKFAIIASNIYLKNKNVSIDFLFSKELEEHTFDAVSAAIQWELIRFSPNFTNILRNYDFKIGGWNNFMGARIL